VITLFLGAGGGFAVFFSLDLDGVRSDREICICFSSDEPISGEDDMFINDAFYIICEETTKEFCSKL
jgi:hypothetical protein